MVRIIADEFLTEERDRKYYADHYTCCPPPLFILLITLIEVSISHWRLRSSSRVLPVATCNVVFQLSAGVSSISLSLYIQVSFSTRTHMNVPFGLRSVSQLNGLQFSSTVCVFVSCDRSFVSLCRCARWRKVTLHVSDIDCAPSYIYRYIHVRIFLYLSVHKMSKRTRFFIAKIAILSVGNFFYLDS